MRTIFFNQYGQIRTGWRAATFLFSFLFLSFFLILISINLISQASTGDSTAGYLPLVVPFTVSAIVAILLGWMYGKLFEGVPFRAIGIAFTTGWLKNLGAGCVIGAISLGSAILIAVMSGGLTLAVNRQSSTSAIGSTLFITLLIFIVGAASEETLFRGYLLQTFGRSGIIWIGVIFTSLLFAFAHNNNPDVSGLALLNTLIAGFWFAVAYLKTRDLWFPLGIHFAWNWLQGPVFGINVSGIAEFSPDPLLRATDAGPAWLTGGAYGIEGGITCTIALIISLGLIYFLPGLKPDDDLLALSEPPRAAGS